MFKELEAFNAASAKYNDHMNQLETELRGARREHERALSQYQRIVQEDSSRVKYHSAAELAAAKRLVDEAKDVMIAAQGRVERFKEGRTAELNTLVNEVAAGFKRELQVELDEIADIVEQARPVVVQLLQMAVKANTHRVRAVQMSRELDRVENLAGIQRPMYYSRLNGLSDYLPLVNSHEIDRVFQTGELPEWAEELT